MSVFQPDILKGKVAFLTGSNGGITFRVAEAYAEHGAKVVLHGRKQEKLDTALKTLQDAGHEVMGFTADVRDYDAVAECLKKTHEAWGEIDIVVCGAAGNFPAPALAMSANGFNTVMNIDTQGTFNTCRASFEYLRKPGASIISISAVHGFIAYPLQVHVCAAKAGVDMITRCLAMEWGPMGVRINSIAPGPIDDTEGMKRLAPGEDSMKIMLENLAIKRAGTKQDVANMALFLASDAASYITGTVMTVDGGNALYGGGGMAKSLGF